MRSSERWTRRRLLTSGVTFGAGVAGLALVGCGDDDDDDDDSGDSNGDFTAGSEIGIGFISSFTGPLATIYAPFSNGAKLAIDEINAAGGIAGAQVKLIEADDSSNPANVPAAALGLVDDEISYCLGPIGSNAISASPTLNQNQILQFGYSDNPKLSDPEEFPFSFRYVWSAEQSSKLLVDFYRSKGYDRIAILAENTVFGQTDAPTTEAYLKSQNLEPTVFEYFQSGTTDFVPILRKAQDTDTEAIVWWTQGGPEGASILRSMDSISYNIPIGGIGLFAFGLVGVVSQAILDNAYPVAWKRTTYTDSEPVPETVIELRDKLAERDWLGASGSGVSPFYDMVYHLKAAIEGAESTASDDIIKWMEENPFDGVIANYTGITAEDHTVTEVDQITLGVLGSFDEANLPFYKRADGI